MSTHDKDVQFLQMFIAEQPGTRYVTNDYTFRWAPPGAALQSRQQPCRHKPSHFLPPLWPWWTKACTRTDPTRRPLPLLLPQYALTMELLPAAVSSPPSESTGPQSPQPATCPHVSMNIKKLHHPSFMFCCYSNTRGTDRVVTHL